MSEELSINFSNQEKEVRKLIHDSNLADDTKLALMSRSEVEELIDDNFDCYPVGDDWLLVPRTKVDEFDKIVKWICR